MHENRFSNLGPTYSDDLTDKKNVDYKPAGSVA